MKKNLWILCVALCVQLPLPAQNDTIIRHYNDTTYRQVTDTVLSVTSIPDSTLKHRVEVIPADSSDRRGHYIEAHVGLGYGSLGYHLDGALNQVNGSFSALLQLQYAYFFHPNWGVGAGLWFTNYTSYARIGGLYTWLDQKDTDTEIHYDHHALVLRWRERQTLHNIGIPISLQFQMRKEHWKAGLFASVGIAPSFSVSHKYRIQEGIIEHSGFYPAWNLWLKDIDATHEFGIKDDYDRESYAKGSLSVRPQVALFADFGALVPLNKQIDLFLGCYGNVVANDANSSAKQEIGWKDSRFPYVAMNEYKGAYTLDMASASHPWEAGVKIGIHWHYIGPDKEKNVDYFDYFERQDTAVQYISRQDTIITARQDTTIRVNKPSPSRIQKAAQEVEKLNKIYFAFDSYQLTNKAKRLLTSMVDILNQEPDAKVAICGHASTEGQTAYNDILSRRRAQAVADYLIRLGLNKDRVEIRSFGSRVPNEDTEYEEMRRDRRVEVFVIEETEETENQ
jgi:outer membrane protein OmpA-like peptidoglycan-associated protein